MKIILTITFIFSLLFADFRECGTETSLSDEAMAALLQSRTELHHEGSRDIFWVPITWHVVRMDNGSQGLSTTRLEQGLVDLNTAYEAVNFQYYQAGEIDYIDDTDYYLNIDSYDEIIALRNENWVANTLNIYCTQNLNNGNYDLCGISTFSWYSDAAIVMSNSCFATADNHSTLPHEVGHYFDLFHTHQGGTFGDNAEYVDGTECWIRGDGCCDTPADPNLSSCMGGACSYICDHTDMHGDLYQPDTSNLMSYATKSCRDFFSEEQFAIVQYCYDTYRSFLNVPPDYPNIFISDVEFFEASGDGDGLINPGESAGLHFALSNFEGWPDVFDISVSISSESEVVELSNSDLNLPNLPSGETIDNSDATPIFSIAPDVTPTIVDVSLDIVLHNESGTAFLKHFDLEFDFHLWQAGWDNDVSSEVEAAAAVLDVRGDDSAEIIFADYSGALHVTDIFGNELSGFPFETGDQIWGAPAIADVDLDGDFEIAVCSKSKHFYLLDTFGTVLVDYDAGEYLMGSPAIGNLDDDPELEIVFAGYHDDGHAFAMNHDGTMLPGFPYFLEEKVLRGPALADFNGDGFDDIVLAGQGGSLFLLHSDGSMRDGFPLEFGSMKSAPVVDDSGELPVIFVGDSNEDFRRINANGADFWLLSSEADFLGSPALQFTGNGIRIAVVNRDAQLFLMDSDGAVQSGFPIQLNGDTKTSPVFADLDGDSSPEIVLADGAGYLHAFRLDGSTIANFPIHTGVPSHGAATVADVDADGDLEILSGCANALNIFDIKTQGSSENWHTGRGNYLRNGRLESSCSNPMLGNLNCDSTLDVLDVILLVNLIMDEPYDSYTQWAADLNVDGIIDILDVISLINLIMEI